MDLDKSFIKRIQFLSAFEEAYNSGIKAEMLFDSSRRVYEYMIDFFSEFSVLPTQETVTEKLGFSFDGIDNALEPVGFYVKELKKRYAGNLTAEHTRLMIQRLQGGSPYEAVDAARELIDKVSGIEIGNNIENILVTGPDRIKEFIAKQSLTDGVDGIKSPWKLLDENTLGWHPGDLIIVVGRVSMGKTFSLIHFTKSAWESGRFPILFVSMEMTASAIGKRWDAFCGKLPFFELRRGRLDSYQQAEYTKVVCDYDKNKPVWVAEGGAIKSVKDIHFLVERLKPKLVMVDGLYLLRGLGRDKWENVTNVILDLKRLAQERCVPVIASTQFHRKVGSESVSGGIENIGFSDMTGMSADIVITLNQTKDMRRENRMLYRVVKNREGPLLDFYVKWNFDKMDFDFLGSKDDFEVSKEAGELRDTDLIKL